MGVVEKGSLEGGEKLVEKEEGRVLRIRRREIRE